MDTILYVQSIMGATDRRRPGTGWLALSAAMGFDGLLAAFMSIQADAKGRIFYPNGRGSAALPC
jgi:hypothetical protein